MRLLQFNHSTASFLHIIWVVSINSPLSLTNYARHSHQSLMSLYYHNKLLAGIQIVRNALQMPITQIVRNTGVNAAEIVDKVLNSENKNMGYDALTSEFVDMFEAGIIDPTKVSRSPIFQSIIKWPKPRDGCVKSV